jgi:hypothetical protein
VSQELRLDGAISLQEERMTIRRCGLQVVLLWGVLWPIGNVLGQGSADVKGLTEQLNLQKKETERLKEEIELPKKEARKDEQAKAIVQQFCKSMFAKDVQGSLELMDVPWVGLFRREPVLDRDELKKQLTLHLAKAEIQDEPEVEIYILTIRKFREECNDKIKEQKWSKELTALDLKADDRVVLVRAYSDEVPVIVQMRDGKPKIVGIFEFDQP